MTELLVAGTGHVACPAGFTAGAVHCGLKSAGADDLALVHCDAGANAAAIFTRNLFRAAPIEISQQHLALSRGTARALLINAGAANAATGEEGKRRARRTVDALATELNCRHEKVLVSSTGVIGVPLPDDRITASLPSLVASCRPDGLSLAARAIMTTDTVPKLTAVQVRHEGRTATVTGIAKGSGMIHPDMATMIAVLMTDAEVAAPVLGCMLRYAADRSFHRISVDGDTSTNDAAFAFASGRAGPFPPELIEEALTAVARELAIMIVRDGEGATKLIGVRVLGARISADALRVGRTVAGSVLVRTAAAGGKLNWGRIIAAIGRSGVNIDPHQVEVSAGGVLLFAAGRPVDLVDKVRENAFAGPSVSIEIDLKQGHAMEECFTCDLTEDYVHINANHTT